MKIFTSIKEKLFGKALETPALETARTNAVLPVDVENGADRRSINAKHRERSRSNTRRS
jgi:hypothetical protein